MAFGRVCSSQPVLIALRPVALGGTGVSVLVDPAGDEGSCLELCLTTLSASASCWLQTGLDRHGFMHSSPGSDAPHGIVRRPGRRSCRLVEEADDRRWGEPLVEGAVPATKNHAELVSGARHSGTRTFSL